MDAVSRWLRASDVRRVEIYQDHGMFWAEAFEGLNIEARQWIAAGTGQTFLMALAELGARLKERANGR